MSKAKLSQFQEQQVQLAWDLQRYVRLGVESAVNTNDKYWKAVHQAELAINQWLLTARVPKNARQHESELRGLQTIRHSFSDKLASIRRQIQGQVIQNVRSQKRTAATEPNRCQKRPKLNAAHPGDVKRQVAENAAEARPVHRSLSDSESETNDDDFIEVPPIAEVPDSAPI